MPFVAADTSFIKPALAQVCSLNSAFEADVEDYAAGQCGAIELWFTKLETFLQSYSTDDVRRVLGEHPIETPVASFQGGLLSSQGAAREEAWRLFESRLELSQQLQISTIVIACDVVGPLKQQDVDRVRMSLKQAAERAESSGILPVVEYA